MLRQKVELLEAESSELAGLLVRGQVSRAEEEETTFIVQRELTALRHTHLETTHALENALDEIKQMSFLITENVSLCFLIDIFFQFSCKLNQLFFSTTLVNPLWMSFQ